jgi:hypothetical protein
MTRAAYLAFFTDPVARRGAGDLADQADPAPLGLSPR